MPAGHDVAGFIESFFDRGDTYAQAVEAFETRLIERAFEKSEGAFSKAASQLDISRHALRYRMQKLGMREGDSREATTKPSLNDERHQT